MTPGQRARLEALVWRNGYSQHSIDLAVAARAALAHIDALAAERDRETALRRDAERHNAELRAALDQARSLYSAALEDVAATVENPQRIVFDESHKAMQARIDQLLQALERVAKHPACLPSAALIAYAALTPTEPGRG